MSRTSRPISRADLRRSTGHSRGWSGGPQALWGRHQHDREFVGWVRRSRNPPFCDGGLRCANPPYEAMPPSKRVALTSPACGGGRRARRARRVGEISLQAWHGVTPPPRPPPQAGEGDEQSVVWVTARPHSKRDADAALGGGGAALVGHRHALDRAEQRDVQAGVIVEARAEHRADGAGLARRG